MGNYNEEYGLSEREMNDAVRAEQIVFEHDADILCEYDDEVEKYIPVENSDFED